MRDGRAGPSRRSDVDMLNEDVPSTLRRMFVPMLLAMVAMVAFNLVDTIYIGQLGTEELAAISFTFPVVFFYIGVATGLGMGVTSIVSRTLGAGDRKKASRLTADGLLLSFLITLIFTILGLLTIDPLFRAMGARGRLLDLIRSYMQIWHIGMVFVVIPMVGNSVIRATGDMKIPMKIMLLAVTINIILDPILIFGLGPFPRWELAGAATATVISRATTMIASLYILRFRMRILKWGRPTLSNVLTSWKGVLHVGAPQAMVNVLTPISFGILTSLVAAHGVKEVAGYGAATRLEALLMMPIYTFGIILVPFIGQNYGAGRIERILESMRIGYRVVIIWGIISFIGLVLTSPWTGRMFNSDAEVLETYSLYFLFSGYGFTLIGTSFLVTHAFNAMGKPAPAAILTLIRVFALIVPFALAGSLVMGLPGLFLGIGAGNLVAGLLSVIWMRKTFRIMIAQERTG